MAANLQTFAQSSLPRAGHLSLVVLCQALFAARAVEVPVDAKHLATITDARLDEISGIVVASTHDGWWVHNDSGDKPRIYAVDRTGTVAAVVSVAGARARDWEDMARFERDGQAYLVCGDVGDNRGKRKHVTLYIIAEPTVTAKQAPVLAEITVTYPDGPRDCEGVAVDGSTGEILLLSKRDTVPRLYAVPLPKALLPKARSLESGLLQKNRWFVRRSQR